MTIPDAAIEAAAKAIHGATTREPKWALTADAYKRFYRNEARVAIEAAMPAIQAQTLADAADAIQALHPGEVKNSVTFLRDRAASIIRGGAA